MRNPGLTHPTQETGFFDENTSPAPTDSLKNPVSGTPCVSPETDRLCLRKMQLDDVADVFEYASDPAVTKYAVWPAHQSIEDSKEFIKAAIDKFKNHKQVRWGIVLKQDAKLIGSCVLFNWISIHGRAEIGYVISSKYWGKGYATEAVRRILAFGFGTMQLNRIYGQCKAFNAASARVMEKVEMKLEGVLRQHKFEKGTYHDMKIYSMLRSEFFEMPI